MTKYIRTPEQEKEHKEYLSKKRKQHNLDRKQAKAIEALGIHHAPLDLPSLHRAVHGGKRVPWLTTGYDWLDTVSHEYVHLVVSRKSRNTVPIWMHEGLAKYLESRWRGPAA